MTATQPSLPATPVLLVPQALRARVSQLRQDLDQTTRAYRTAAAQHDSPQAISLLRARSALMRELLEAQCELLLALRHGGEGPAA